METTYTRPPKEILDVLHEAEAADVEIPKIVDDWWAGEPKLSAMMQRELAKQEWNREFDLFIATAKKE